jgi:hypothetical protein
MFQSSAGLDEVETTSIKLLELLTGNWAGCSEQEHRVTHNDHIAREGSNHHDLSATYGNPGDLQLSSKVDVGLFSCGFPKNKEIPREAYPEARELQHQFEGTKDEVPHIRNICLHEEEVEHTEPIRSFDTDSLLVFPRSFAAFRTHFRVCIAKQTAYNIDSDIHVEVEIETAGQNGEIQRQKQQLRKIPHLYLGTVDGFYHGAVYIFFPRLFETNRQSNYLTNEQAQRFFDRAMWPACSSFLDESRIQHFPPTQSVAELNARAKGIEQRQYYRDGSSKRFTTLPLQVEKHGQIWNTLQQAINSPDGGLYDFCGAFLFLNVKGFKMDFKVTGSLFAAMRKFDDHLKQVLDLELVDQFAVDVGSEVCPSSSNYSTDNDCEGVTYLWKKCCLKAIHNEFIKDGFNGKKGQATFYHTGFLRDAACMTLVPPTKSLVRRSGLLYGQWYASVKEIGNAQACYPFDWDPITELAFDKNIWEANNASAKQSHTKDWLSRVASYEANKTRIREAYLASQDTSFGLRMEFRVQKNLWHTMMCLAGSLESYESLPCWLSGPPSSAWSLSTRNYTQFMIGNYHKIASVIEICSATSPQTGITLDRTRLMAVLLQCLQRFANSNLARESALWYNRRETNESTVKWGMGLEDTVEKYGFGWFRPVVDWEKLRFQEASGELAGLDQTLLPWYRAGSHLIRDTMQEISFCFERLKDKASNQAVKQEVMVLLAHLCCRQYRRDILTSLASELRPCVIGDQEKDAVQFSYSGLQQALASDFHLVNGNKTLVKNPADLVDWLWGSSIAYNRTHFENKPFRVLYKKVDGFIKSTGEADWKDWHKIFQDQFFAFHWAIPYPDINGSAISTSKTAGKVSSKRQIYAIDRNNHGQPWKWAKNRPRGGYPGAYPSILTMDTNELVAHLEAVARRCI